MAALQHSLARAKGRGSAGQCPASYAAKTPAARESVAPLGRLPQGSDALADATAQLSDAQTRYGLLAAELAQLRAAARTYYVHSHTAGLTPEAHAAGARLVRLLAHAGAVA